MRKVILGVAVSLDGFIEGPKGEYDWCFTDQDYGLNDLLKRVDALFIGRKTFEMMKGRTFGKKKHHYVFSNSLTHIPPEIEIIKGDLEPQVREIKGMKGKDIWLFGGAALTTSLMNEGLVDEFWLAVHPILLGAGKPLFQGIRERTKTKLIDSRTFNTGLVSLNYQVNQ